VSGVGSACRGGDRRLHERKDRSRAIEWGKPRRAGRPGRPPSRCATRSRGGGFWLSDGFISPLDLIAIGLVSAEEAKELHDLEQVAAAARRDT
jgi:hypothetical protein